MLGLFLGTIYSLPFPRTKRSPLLAALTIATVRGFLLNFGVFYAVKEAIGAPFMWSAKVKFISRFMTVFAGVIAVTKDLTDVEGDREGGIKTWASTVGVGKMTKVSEQQLMGGWHLFLASHELLALLTQCTKYTVCRLCPLCKLQLGDNHRYSLPPVYL